MKLFPGIILVLLAGLQASMAQQQALAQRLGYPEGSKLLIIHADDLGVAYSENSASIAALEQGPVNSASIMVPCPWFPDIAAYARNHKFMDFGLHLTLNSEWKYYKWGPVTSLSEVPSLVNANGYFYSLVDSLQRAAKPEEVKIELENQVKKAYRFGIDVTHLDAHMGAAASTPEFLKAYIEVGKAYRLPVLLDKRVYLLDDKKVNALLDKSVAVLDGIHTAGPEDYKSGMAAFYTKVLEGLDPGVHCLLIHLAYNDAEMKAMTIDHPDWGAGWRQADFDFFTSRECEKILEKEQIILITWREIRDKISRAE